MAPVQHPEPVTAAPAPVPTCHNTASTAAHHCITRNRETAGRGYRRVLRAIIAISRCDPMPPMPDHAPCPATYPCLPVLMGGTSKLLRQYPGTHLVV